MKKILFLILPALFLFGCDFDSYLYDYPVESVTYNGHVYDKNTSLPVYGVHVYVYTDGEDNSGFTDANGFYSVTVDVPCTEETIIIFGDSAVYGRVEISVPAQSSCSETVHDVYLEPL
ncbi:MAG: hypothetical protein ACRCUT_11155 [Spirochaetota bacterium]